MVDIPKNKYVNGKFLKKDLILFRKYQVELTKSCLSKNSLVVLPTALGKTIIAILAAVKYIEKYKGSKILVLSPTKPLVMQHFETFTDFLTSDINMSMLIGHLKPIKRALLINESSIIFSTPQIIKNDILRGSIELRDFSLIVFDEAHKARKSYAYTFIAESYMKTGKKPHILGLTASPGKDPEFINNLIQKLYIERICFKTEDDIDVKDYIFPIELFVEKIDLSMEIVEIQVLLKTAVQEIIDYFIGEGILPVKNYYSKVDFIRLNYDFRLFDIYGEDYDDYYFPNVPTVLKHKPNKKFVFISKAISGIYYLHMQEILTTQTPKLFTNYVNRLKLKSESGLKSVNRILNSKYFKKFINDQLDVLENLDSPKISTVLDIIQTQFAEKSSSKIIIFTQYRDMASILLEKIKNLGNPNIIPCRFVGQSSKPGDRGLTQDMQREIIGNFKKAGITVLIATSIAEEGLDIPSVDSIIFYEPVPSEIRLIQRRGRTGRHAPGKCYIICANDTLDEIYLNVAFRKEKRMKQTLLSEEDLEFIINVNRTDEIFIPDKKTSKEIFNFFKNVENKKKKAAEQAIALIKSVNESEAEKKRLEILKQYSVRDLTQEIGQISLNRLRKRQEK